MPITKTQRAFVLDRDGSRCFLCGATAEQEKLEVDHWFPKALGGSDDIENLITLCQPCNRGKGKMYFGRYVALVRERVVARPLHRADIVPPLAYQADVISQIGQHLLTSGVPRVTLAQLVRLLTNLSLRDRINPACEPLSFPLVEEGLQALVASGELTPEGDETFAIQTPSAAKKVGASRQLETDVGLLALGDLVKSEPIAAIKEAYTNIERELQVILEAHVPGKYDVGDRGVVDLARLAVSNGIIKTETADSVEGIAVMHNLAIRGDEATETHADEYVALADGVLYSIRQNVRDHQKRLGRDK